MPDNFILIAALIYFAVISLIAIVLTVYDKGTAKAGSWRVKEQTLLLVSILGGSIAMLATMKAIRHKTQHPKFMVGIPLIILLQFVLLAAIWWRFPA